MLATTLSLAVILAPIAFMSGLAGRFFNSFGFVVRFAIPLGLVGGFTHPSSHTGVLPNSL